MTKHRQWTLDEVYVTFKHQIDAIVKIDKSLSINEFLAILTFALSIGNKDLNTWYDGEFHATNTIERQNNESN